MVEIPDRLACLFTGSVTEAGDSYTIEVPKEELDVGAITAGETYQIVLLENPQPADSTDSDDQQEGLSTNSVGSASRDPPVSRGEMREVTIETLGEQGDGIAKLDRGYVLIVPDAQPDDEVTVEITEVRQNVAFAEVRDRADF
ncbi:TRAM domain-containing protein (plasmid) [Halococcus dombrowskii]|jgi:predicted RNA-binding protein with TRAM domain|uniref:TRAM domain-containing protein n=1 Tax=Halococcus dombrowskii TaxID=179637 RepID=A0AAV3SGW4_HALDO|nr:TRAM domain-containing protein [Halococcus dombrowskii]UOO97172.1 TRAM domain-containing protein [Halococcus dombrowskii]